MMCWSHVFFSTFIVLLLIDLIQPVHKFWFIVVVAIGSIFADIDSPESKIGKHFKFIGKIFGHRGIFHSFFMAFLISYLFSLVFGYFWAFFLGYSLHLFIDSLTVMGVKPFLPFSDFKTEGFIKTNSLAEKLIFWITLFGTTYLFFVKIIL